MTDVSSRAANPKLGKARAKALDLERTAALIDRIAALQDKLYAQRRQKVLLVLQGMDTAGKDGTVRALFSRISPWACVRWLQVADRQRTGARLPVARAPACAGPGRDRHFQPQPLRGCADHPVQGMIDDEECQRRYAQIRDFERMLAETGTVIVKVFLHISKEEQRQRLQERLDDPDKQWKFNPEDIKQRAKWDDYQRAYEKAIRETDAPHAPWYMVPANSKTHRNLVIASLLLETLEAWTCIIRRRIPTCRPSRWSKVVLTGELCCN
jgi:polyphosphate kinase 2 (PPK2 family)